MLAPLRSSGGSRLRDWPGGYWPPNASPTRLSGPVTLLSVFNEQKTHQRVVSLRDLLVQTKVPYGVLLARTQGLFEISPLVHHLKSIGVTQELCRLIWVIVKENHMLHGHRSDGRKMHPELSLGSLMFCGHSFQRWPLSSTFDTICRASSVHSRGRVKSPQWPPTSCPLRIESLCTRQRCVLQARYLTCAFGVLTFFPGCSPAVVKKILKAKTNDQRAKIPGLQKQRADVIVGGAILLEEIFEAMSIEKMKVRQLGQAPLFLLKRDDQKFTRLSTQSIR